MHVCDLGCSDHIIQFNKPLNMWGCTSHGRFHFCDKTKHDCYATYTGGNRFHKINSTSRNVLEIHCPSFSEPSSPIKKRRLNDRVGNSVGNSPEGSQEESYSQPEGTNHLRRSFNIFRRNNEMIQKEDRHSHYNFNDCNYCVFSKQFHSNELAPPVNMDPKCSEYIKELEARGKLNQFLRKELSCDDYTPKPFFEVEQEYASEYKANRNKNDKHDSRRDRLVMPTETIQDQSNLSENRKVYKNRDDESETSDMEIDLLTSEEDNPAIVQRPRIVFEDASKVYDRIRDITTTAQYNPLELNLFFEPSAPNRMFVEGDYLWSDHISPKVKVGLESLKRSLVEVAFEAKRSTKSRLIPDVPALPVLPTHGRTVDDAVDDIKKLSIAYKSMSSDTPVVGRRNPSKECVKTNRMNLINNYDSKVLFFETEMKKRIEKLLFEEVDGVNTDIADKLKNSMGHIYNFAKNLYILLVSRVGVSISSPADSLHTKCMDAALYFFAYGLKIKDVFGSEYVICDMNENIRALLPDKETANRLNSAPKHSEFFQSATSGRDISLAVIDQLRLHPSVLEKVLYSNNPSKIISIRDL